MPEGSLTAAQESVTLAAQASVVPPPGFSPPGVNTRVSGGGTVGGGSVGGGSVGGGSVGGGSVGGGSVGGGSVGGGSVGGGTVGVTGVSVGVILITGDGESVMVGVAVGLPMVILATSGWLASPLLLTATTEMA